MKNKKFFNDNENDNENFPSGWHFFTFHFSLFTLNLSRRSDFGKLRKSSKRAEKATSKQG